MRDPRVRVAPQVAHSGGDRFLAALDDVRPIVRVTSGVDPWTAMAAASAFSMLVRLFPHTQIDGNAPLLFGPWRVRSLDELPQRFARSTPQPSRRPSREIRIGVGTDSGADIYLGGDDWTMVLADSPVAASARGFGLGLQASAVFGAAEVLKQVLRPLGLISVATPPALKWNLLDYTLTAAHSPPLPASVALSLAFFGAGSVGSSAVGILTSVPSLTGHAVVVDKDTFDPDRNPYRYPASSGDEIGPKAEWLSGLLSDHGWSAAPSVGTVAQWVGAQQTPGFDGIAISSVDRVEGRLEVADTLARSTLSVGVGGLALHLQREVLGDGFACPYCDFVDVGPTLGRVEHFHQMTGLSLERLAKLIDGDSLSAEDIRTAVQAGKVESDRAKELEGRRFDDLLGRIYAEATVPITGQAADVSVAAPFMSWMGGLLLAAELVKAAHGLSPIDRRVDLDMTGVPSGFVYKRPAASARCVCASPIRREWMRRLYGS